MSSPHGGYYMSLLSEYFQEDMDHDDYGDDEIDVREVPPKTGMTSDSKMKGWFKNFSEDEDNLLVSAWLNVGQDPVDGNQQKMKHSGEELRLIIMSTKHSSRTVIGPH
jgi:hypothetical protein